MHSGSCLCGAVRWRAEALRDSVSICHCEMCRRWSGHLWAATRGTGTHIEGPVRWYRSSDHAERGFCTTCGSSLFYRPIGARHVGVAAGSVDAPTGLHAGKHIYADRKGDWYEIEGDLPREDAP